MTSHTPADPRRTALTFGLSQLSPVELEQLREALASSEVLLDHGNYDAELDIWCPLAVGLGFPECWDGPAITSDEEAKAAVLAVGRARHGTFSLNPIKGIDGSFFTSHRREDLLALVDELLEPTPTRIDPMATR